MALILLFRHFEILSGAYKASQNLVPTCLPVGLHLLWLFRITGFPAVLQGCQGLSRHTAFALAVPTACNSFPPCADGSLSSCLCPDVPSSENPAMVTLVQVASPHPHGLQPSPSIYPALIFITLLNTFLKKCLYCHILSSQINFLRAGTPVLQNAWGPGTRRPARPSVIFYPMSGISHLGARSLRCKGTTSSGIF